MELIGLAIVLVFALAIVIFFTRGVFARDLTSALKRVTQQEQELQAKADILEQRISQMERDYHVKVKRAEVEAERIIQEAKNQAMNIRATAIEEAKYRARQLLLEAEQGRSHLKAELAKELDGQAIRHACDSLRALLPASQLSSLHDLLVQELLEALKRLDVRTLCADVVHIDVLSAQALAPAASQQLAQWAVKVFGPSVPLHVKTDPTLVVGCVVRLGSTTLDNSLVHRLDQR